MSIEGDLNKPNVEFNADGDLRSTELKIMNLRPSVTSKGIVWEEIGVWKSWQTNAQQQLDIRDIYWPGNSHAPVSIRSGPYKYQKYFIWFYNSNL